MLILIREEASAREIKDLKNFLSANGLRVNESLARERIFVIQNLPDGFEDTRILSFPCVAKIVKRTADYKKVINAKPISIDHSTLGSGDIMMIAGPCAIDSISDFEETVKALVSSGIRYTRLGLFKPRTSPYSYRGRGKANIRLLSEIKNSYGIKYVGEVLDIREFSTVDGLLDIYQIGSRNMQNFPLLEEAGKTDKPVLLKRGFCATIEELLLSAEYILNKGNPNVILCERGIRTFEQSTRNTLDISAIPVIKEQTKLPVIADPSHAGGNRKLVRPLSLASIAAGADGLMLEVRVHPHNSLCDAHETITTGEFKSLLAELQGLAAHLGRRIATFEQPAATEELKQPA